MGRMNKMMIKRMVHDSMNSMQGRSCRCFKHAVYFRAVFMNMFTFDWLVCFFRWIAWINHHWSKHEVFFCAIWQHSSLSFCCCTCLIQEKVLLTPMAPFMWGWPDGIPKNAPFGGTMSLGHFSMNAKRQGLMKQQPDPPSLPNLWNAGRMF